MMSHPPGLLSARILLGPFRVPLYLWCSTHWPPTCFLTTNSYFLILYWKLSQIPLPHCKIPFHGPLTYNNNPHPPWIKYVFNKYHEYFFMQHQPTSSSTMSFSFFPLYLLVILDICLYFHPPIHASQLMAPKLQKYKFKMKHSRELLFKTQEMGKSKLERSHRINMWIIIGTF